MEYPQLFVNLFSYRLLQSFQHQIEVSIFFEFHQVNIKGLGDYANSVHTLGETFGLIAFLVFLRVNDALVKRFDGGFLVFIFPHIIIHDLSNYQHVFVRFIGFPQLLDNTLQIGSWSLLIFSQLKGVDSMLERPTGILATHHLVHIVLLEVVRTVLSIIAFEV